MMKYSVLIPAAGEGRRMELGYNKVFYRMDDRTVIEHTMDLFLKDPDCEEIVVVTDAAFYCRTIPQGRGKVVLVKGGKTRQESVCNGLRAVISDTVLVHDGVRPYLTEDCLRAVKEAMETEEAACLAVPVKDTVKCVQNGYVESTPDRTVLYNAQTPQAFRTDLLRTCMEAAVRDGFTGTDDCSVVERYSDARIRIVAGSYDNIKLTTPEDIRTVRTPAKKQKSRVC